MLNKSLKNKEYIKYPTIHRRRSLKRWEKKVFTWNDSNAFKTYSWIGERSNCFKATFSGEGTGKHVKKGVLKKVSLGEKKGMAARYNHLGLKLETTLVLAEIKRHQNYYHSLGKEKRGKTEWNHTYCNKKTE